MKAETSAGHRVFSVRSDSRGHCAAAASALGQGRRAWRPAVLPKLARGQSGAGEKRGVTSDPSTSTGAAETRKGAFAWPGRLREARAGVQNWKPAAGWVPRPSGFFTAHPAARASDSRTHARTHLHRSLTHTHSPRVQNRPVPRRVAGWGRARWSGRAPSAAG